MTGDRPTVKRGSYLVDTYIADGSRLRRSNLRVARSGPLRTDLAFANGGGHYERCQTGALGRRIEAGEFAVLTSEQFGAYIADTKAARERLAGEIGEDSELWRVVKTVLARRLLPRATLERLTTTIADDRERWASLRVAHGGPRIGPDDRKHASRLRIADSLPSREVRHG